MINDIFEAIKGLVNMPKYELKKGVLWTPQNDKYFDEEFFKIVRYYYNMYFGEDTEIIITSAQDSHLPPSMHCKGMALDFRTRHLVSKHLGVKRVEGADNHQWNQMLCECWCAIANLLPDMYFIVHVKKGQPHVHVQVSRENIKSESLFTKNGKHHNIRIK